MVFAVSEMGQERWIISKYYPGKWLKQMRKTKKNYLTLAEIPSGRLRVKFVRVKSFS
jgi:hypothetical protein